MNDTSISGTTRRDFIKTTGRIAAVSALAASLAARLRRAMEAAGVGASLFWHLQAEQGALLVVPTPGGTLVVAVAEPDVNVGLVRLELLRAAEVVG